MTHSPARAGVARRRWSDRDVEIAYETFGPSDGAPLLLITGTGEQRYLWPDGFCAALVERGFQVTRFDNRDTGESTRFDDAGPPSQAMMWLRPASQARYTLEDMADDALAVIDAQGWDRAHVAGTSMGGMLAQVLACRHPDRVRSLTSMSSTPAPHIGLPNPRSILRLRKATRAPVTDLEGMVRQLVAIAEITGSPGYPVDTELMAEMARQSFPRRNDLAAHQRHTAAVAAAGDRRAELRALRVPTLVLHGEADAMVRPAGGRATADAVPGARLRTFPGLGHDLPPPLWGEITDAIADLAGLAAHTVT